MKLLSIGNSFSRNAHTFLKPMCDSLGIDIYAANLYVGGCSLKQHMDFYTRDEAAYDYQVNAEFERKISLREALEAEKWDIITVQQVSGWSGIPESYEPYLGELLKIARAKQPEAKFYFHETWSYSEDSQHRDFVNYNSDRRFMYECIKKTSAFYAGKYGLEMIPAGDLINYLRERSLEFKDGGENPLSGDGFHLQQYGLYAASALWVSFLFGKSACAIDFSPEWADEKLLSVVKKAVDTVLMGLDKADI